MWQESKVKHLLDVHLAEVIRQFISIQSDEVKHAQNVFKDVFEQVKQAMDQQCNYFKKYSRQVLYAGSVYDGTKVSKMNEIDINIVIKLPVCYDEIIIENDQPGFIRMKITRDFDYLDKQPDWENCHKVLRDWRDSDKYLQQIKIRSWLHGIVTKAVNQLKGRVEVSGTTYLLSYKEAGPAYTLAIRNERGNEDFHLDVDLVPVIRFMHPRRPKGYTIVDDIHVRSWYVVPKPNKAMLSSQLKNRCWRLSFQDHEREMMKDSQSLKTTIRLVKKLRDGLGLKHIASYYIKTLFLWEIAESDDKTFWVSRLSVTFRRMVEELYDAVNNGNIPYFWHKELNLLEGVKPSTLRLYAGKLREVLDAIDANNCKKVVCFLLTTTEMRKFEVLNIYSNMTASLTLHEEMAMITKFESAVNENVDPLSPESRKLTTFTKRLLDIRVRVIRSKVAFNKEVQMIEDMSSKLNPLRANIESIPNFEQKHRVLTDKIKNLKTTFALDNAAAMEEWTSLKDECYKAKDILERCSSYITKENYYEKLCDMEDRFTKLMITYNRIDAVRRQCLFTISFKFSICPISKILKDIKEISKSQVTPIYNLQISHEPCSNCQNKAVPSFFTIVMLVSLAAIFFAILCNNWH